MLYLSVDDLGYLKYLATFYPNSESILLLDTSHRFYKSREFSWGTII